MSEKELIEKFEELRKDFSILREKINGNNLVYVDNSATSQKPNFVIDKIVEFYKTYNSNVHRGIHTLSEKATKEYEEARIKISKFIGAKENEVVFTSGTTESINIICNGFSNLLEEDDEIILLISEHHSNIVPWQELANRTKSKIIYLKLNEDFNIDLKNLKSLINEKTKIISLAHISNVLGTIFPIKEIAKIAHENDSYLVIDAAQSVPHMKVDVKDLDCDFLVFSGHKMLSSTGIGILYGKYKLLDKLNPVKFGGSMISKVELEKSEYLKPPLKFEAGTPNIEGAISLGSAVDYLNNIGIGDIERYESLLTEHFLEKSKALQKTKIYGPTNPKSRAPVFSLVIEGLDSYDISTLLNNKGIAIRSGHHCAIPLTKNLDVKSLSRISFYFYNTLEEIDFIIESLKEIEDKYSK